MYKHQTIEYDKRLPAKTSLCDSAVNRCRGEPHWHEEIRFSIRRKATVTFWRKARRNGERWSF